jgi:hypothetical protein
MTNQTSLYEPLTSENAALVLVDHQVGLMTGVRDYLTGELKHNVIALAKAAKALKLPIVVTTTARDSMWGPTFPELVDALPGVEIIDRSSVNAFDDERVAKCYRGDRPQKADLCRHFPRSLRGASGHHRRRERTGRLRSGRCFGNVQRDQTPGRIATHAAGRRHRVGLRNFDGGNPQGQCATGSSGGLRGDGHALGQARGPDRPSVREIIAGAGVV